MIASVDQTATNLGVAALLGACIGFERQWRQRMAGVRTNTLVVIGAASFVIIESLFPDEASPPRCSNSSSAASAWSRPFRRQPGALDSFWNSGDLQLRKSNALSDLPRDRKPIRNINPSQT